MNHWVICGVFETKATVSWSYLNSQLWVGPKKIKQSFVEKFNLLTCAVHVL